MGSYLIGFPSLRVNFKDNNKVREKRRIQWKQTKKFVEGNKQWASIKCLTDCGSVTLFDVPSVRAPPLPLLPPKSLGTLSWLNVSSAVLHPTSGIRHQASVIQPSFSSSNLLASLLRGVGGIRERVRQARSASEFHAK